jgi:hypothetical protein
VPIVWAVHDGVKVKRDDLANPNKAKNAVWDGKRVRLLASRNEVVAFQVIVEAGDAGIARLSAALPALTREGGGGAITYAAPAVDPTLYRGRPIQVFSEHYLSVTQATRASWIFAADSPAAPKDPLGWTPVQLVPENATAGRGGFPLKVAPRQNQGLWFDIYAGRDLPPGRYRGEIDVTIETSETQTAITPGAQPARDASSHRKIPIELELLDLRLPDENSLRTMVYYQDDEPELYQGRNLDPAYHRFAKRNRFEFVDSYDPASAQAAIDRFTGKDFTRERDYEGPGEGVGNHIVPRTFYGPGQLFTDRAQAWRTADEWITFLDQHIPGAFTFLYMPDEPRRDKYPQILAIGENIHSNPGPGKKLKTFVTHAYAPELAPAIDVWCAVPWQYDLTRAASERAAGKEYWFYNGGRPAAGAIIIDSPATDARVAGWAAFKHHADGYFHWHAMHWRHNSQKKIGDRNQNVWVEPITFDNRSETKPDQGFINGDGVLVYPGEEKLHPDQDRGIAGPISTIQLANLRRGLQDHLLLTMAREKGLDEVVNRAVQRVVPRVLGDAKKMKMTADDGPAPANAAAAAPNKRAANAESDANPGSGVGFSEDGNDYEEARQLVARALAARLATPAKGAPR